MFAFVCPIRHPDSSNDYDQVLKYLRLTIESVCSQDTDEEFILLVVCNVQPDFENVPNNVRFVIVDFPPPDDKKASEVSYEAITLDKGTKVSAGLLALRSMSPTFVYIMDGDDWFNTNIIKHASQSKADVLYANSGYVLNMSTMTYARKFGLCRYCGSTFIYRYQELMHVTKLSQFEGQFLNQGELIKHVDSFVLQNILGNHRHQFKFLEDNGWAIEPLDFDSVVWVLNTGENYTAQNIFDRGISLSENFLSKFGIESMTFNPKRTPLVNYAIATIVSVQSFFGWLLTNTKNEKV